MSTIVIHGSTRENGNTEYLAHQAVPEQHTTHIYLRNYHIEAIKDERHSEEGFKKIEDDHHTIIDQMLNHDVIIFATPIYWYSMSGLMKNFIDRFSQVVREPGYETFKEDLQSKQVYVIAAGGDNPGIKGLPLIQQFEYILQFFGSSLDGYLIGKAGRPGDIKNDSKALSEARMLKEKLSL
ncbi:flavodoxin family protein [Halobacillus sp. A5]|uniref:flavodoxin family protein n=1 Tax=Halobacillus sp. A5 TaxID=2880263 RepID=UPI0020A6D1A3|nr:flavodoxin family protein [Halobacillus sp. A5]MCP3027253.1 flavodoxin family protein [Halobacillus sp. A5]